MDDFAGFVADLFLTRQALNWRQADKPIDGMQAGFDAALFSSISELLIFLNQLAFVDGTIIISQSI